jgi:hypothetical protein
MGTPLIVPPNEKKLTFFIAAEKKSLELFGVKTMLFNKYPAPAIVGYMYVDKHLRLYPISQKKTKDDTDSGRLWNDGKLCSKAYDHVKVWCLGPMHSAEIKDIDGNHVANIRPRTIKQYNSILAAHPDPKDPASTNEPLAFIYQIQIDIRALPKMPIPGEIGTLAWMMEVPDIYKTQSQLNGLTDWEYQDKLIYDFLTSQKNDSQKSHFSDLYEFDLKGKNLSTTSLPPQSKNLMHRLMAWHPIMIGKKHELKIGHLSDVHVNCRHFALGKSAAQVIEGISATLGPKVANSFLALKNLFDEMKKSGADCIFITGDLIDFNRNIDPSQVDASIKDQWSKFNVVKNIAKSKIYKRGLDDMLVFSLVRYSYKELKLPVFITTGNHEAYDVPYGISPRKNKKVMLTGVLETTGDLKGPHGSREVNTTITPSYIPPVDIMRAANKLQVKEKYASLDDNEYNHGKANEGVPADHNLTIYEAALIYGPSYAQALTSQNFTPDNYDWFFTLFTPLCDFVISYNEQNIIGLDWGASENYVNLAGALNPTNSDFQGAGILPRSVESISEHQKELLSNAFYIRKNNPASTLLFSHFTLINFAMDMSLREKGKQRKVQHEVGQLNKNNCGTFEKEQSWLFEACINNKVRYHFSGHSHRAGVYKVEKSENLTKSAKKDVRIVSGFDPGIEPNHTDNAVGPLTKLIVSSSGGPIGVQNHDNELYGFNMQLPSGTLLDQAAERPIVAIKADSTKNPHIKPRLCVALDYLWIMWTLSDYQQSENPIEFFNQYLRTDPMVKDTLPDYFTVRLGNRILALNCIKEINFWIYIDETGFDAWENIKMTIKSDVPAGTQPKNCHLTLSFSDAQQKARLDKILHAAPLKSTQHMFCEVVLKNPSGVAVQHYNWQDSWFFPIITTMFGGRWHLKRPQSEAGEIPNWNRLYKTDPTKYPSPKLI